MSLDKLKTELERALVALEEPRAAPSTDRPLAREERQQPRHQHEGGWGSLSPLGASASTEEGCNSASPYQSPRHSDEATSDRSCLNAGATRHVRTECDANVSREVAGNGFASSERIVQERLSQAFHGLWDPVVQHTKRLQHKTAHVHHGAGHEAREQSHHEHWKPVSMNDLLGCVLREHDVEEASVATMRPRSHNAPR
mmetsp:Transcript_112674/g.224092  ORF Transcript_112674/g.224092 Transcript_112674/m.224092 type:complete len:198 (-) Transcript_112674:142-735(-)